jgi:dTDP-glucose 4,6-dehydratase
MPNTVLITGGSGFLGSHIVRRALADGFRTVVNVDALTYAGDRSRLADIESDPRYVFHHADVTDEEAVIAIVERELPDVIVHAAAESHVTRGEGQSDLFYRTNVGGTRSVLEAAFRTSSPRVVHISTDEVYGPILEGSFGEGDKVPGDQQATSVYARSKAVADDLAQSYRHKLDVTIVRPTNLFGPWQLPEKAVARWITRGLKGLSLPVWGDGTHVRQWLHVDSCVDAVMRITRGGLTSATYNVAPRFEATNLEMASRVAAMIGIDPAQVQLTSYDRPGHDRRYALEAGSLRGLGWHADETWPALAATISWYRANEMWWRRHWARCEALYDDTGITSWARSRVR